MKLNVTWKPEAAKELQRPENKGPAHSESLQLALANQTTLCVWRKMGEFR